jgi:hypothetical protein
MAGSLARALAATALAVALGACSPSDEGTQPSPDVTTFEQGDFGDIPLLAGSEALSPLNEEEGVVARSFAIRNTTPEEVLDFYTEQLAGDEELEAPSAIGVDTFRGRWQLENDRVLTVSATLSTNLRETGELADTEVITQYSLSLSPEPE